MDEAAFPVSRKLSSWDRHKNDPVWREKKRLRARKWFAQKYRESRPYLEGIPVRRGNKKFSPLVIAKKEERRAAKVAELERHRALVAQWYDCQILHCKRCHLPFLRKELPRERRCKACRKQIKKEKRRKDPEGARLRRRAAKHRRRAAKRGNGGSCSPTQWLAIVAKHESRCQRCGMQGEMTRDHIIPLSKGGSDDHTNIQPLCHRCNSLKSDEIEAPVQAFIPGVVPMPKRA